MDSNHLIIFHGHLFRRPLYSMPLSKSFHQILFSISLPLLLQTSFNAFTLLACIATKILTCPDHFNHISHILSSTSANSNLLQITSFQFCLFLYGCISTIAYHLSYGHILYMYLIAKHFLPDNKVCLIAVQ